MKPESMVRKQKRITNQISFFNVITNVAGCNSIKARILSSFSVVGNGRRRGEGIFKPHLRRQTRIGDFVPRKSPTSINVARRCFARRGLWSK